MSKVSFSNSSSGASGTSRSSIRSSNSSKINVSHHNQAHHSRHTHHRDSKQMFLNRELPPIPISKPHQPLPPPPPPPLSKGPQIWTIPSYNSFGAFANTNTNDANYYSVNNYGTYRQKSYTSDDIYIPKHGAYATSAISTTGLENPGFYSDVDLTNIIRKAVYMSSISSAEGNKNLNNHHHHNPVPVLPPFTVNQNQQQRLRNEIIASEATLPSIDSVKKRPLHRFWEMRRHDTDRDTQTKNRTTIFCLAILVICLAIVVIGVSGITYWMISKNWSLDWDEFNTEDNKHSTDSVQLESESNNMKGSQIVLGEFTITNRVFTDDLLNRSKQEFDILDTEVKKAMDEIFLESPLARVYNETQISGFSENDVRGVIVKCRISLKVVLLTAAQEVGLTFIQALEGGHGRLPAGNLRVDIRTIKFTALSGTIPPIILPNAGKSVTDSPLVKENYEIKLRVLWSNWSEWSPCRGLNNKCDSGRIHSRIRKCIDQNGNLVNSDICRLNNKEQQEIEIRDCECDEESTHKMHSQFDNNNNKYNFNTTTITYDISHSSLNTDHRDRACNDCKESEICLLQVKANFPFCAQIKDSRDPRGCGGWCSGHKELCRYVSSQTYQCVDDSECLEGEWQCANGLCIPESRRCDGHFNCFDMSDEMHCKCKEDEFHCGNETSCLSLSLKCDGIIHCWDGEDEQNCTKFCSENQFTCNTGGQCIPIEFFCDGRHKHCDDGSDEPDGCSVQCLSNERQCKNGRCVLRTAFCDGINNCEDNSDEIDCPKTLSANRTKTNKKEAPVLTLSNNDRKPVSATTRPHIRTKRLFYKTSDSD